MDKKTKNQYEIRTYRFQMENVDAEEKEPGVVYGRPVVYNSRTNIGPFDEVIESGALDTTNLKDVRFLVNHNFDMVPLARSRNNTENSTMRLMPDENGLAVRIRLDVENNTEAKNLYSAIKRGDLDKMSFAFSIPKGGDIWEGLESEHPFRRIRKIEQIFEVSAVSFPAYEDTELGVRSEDNNVSDDALRVLENARINKKPLDSDKDETRALELEKLKAEALYF